MLLFTFYILHFTFYISSASALDSTPSADIRAKLEELKKEIASKAAKLKQEVNRKLRDKAYTGTVKSASETTLTLAASSGPKVININQDTLFENETKSKKKFTSWESISQEDYLAALGDIDETGVLTAKKIILLPPTIESKTFLWGKIVSISDELVTLKSKDSKNIAASLPDLSEVKLNDFVILTGAFNKNELFETEFVYVIPQGGVIRPKKVATPSASLKPASR
ncbi:hypothetical protein HY383_03275 [Candidatus Daviesbacteria bacterium]|nr:hypothetical protein [Candidatus Daviesbacteria bacterium]